MAVTNKQVRHIIKPGVFLLCLLPAVALVIGAVYETLGTNPVETMTHKTGEWTLRFVLLTLAVTPVRQLFNVLWLIKLRRMLGLFTFFYACLHFMTYVWLDQYFDWLEIIKDIQKRPFITVGFTAFILLIPLALTSTNKMMQRLKKNWAKLHQLVYVIALLGVFHYLWLVKADVFEPLVYASILLVLLGYRSYSQRTKKSGSVPNSH